MCRRLEREFNARPRRAAAAAAATAAGPPPPRAAGEEGAGEEVRDLDCLEEEADAADGVDGSDSDSDSDQEGNGGGGREKEEEAEEEGNKEEAEAGAAAAGPVAALPLFAMLPPDQQARVFRPPRAGHRLIVVATNVAETSITIPGIKYVVDCGRAKERRLHHASGVAQFEVGWISQASADQRAGRAGRTGPGHCYRLYSSAVYLQQFPQFAEPEVATRALEDVVLQMKAMGVPRPDRFPFPTPPAAGGLRAAQALLEALGAARAAADDGDEAPAAAAAAGGAGGAGGGGGGGGGGAVTPLGRRMAALPVGVRFAKMLVVGAAHGVLGHTVALAAALAERDPFLGHGAQQPTNKEEKSNDAAVAEAETLLEQEERRRRAGVRAAWAHPTSDALARLRALGAAAHALAAAQAEEEADPAAGGRRPRRGHRRGAAAAAAGGGEPSPRAAAALAAFCRARLLHAPTVGRALSLRAQLHRLARLRLRCPPAAASAGGGGGKGGAKEREEEGDEAQEGPAAAAAARLPLLPPPTPAQEELLKQVFLSGHLDCVARRAPPGTVTEGGRYQRTAAYLSCNPAIAEPLYLHRGSDLYAKDPELQPKWVCYQSVIRRPRKDGSSTACMACVTAIDPAWLAALAAGTPLLRLSPPLQSPPPFYDPAEGALRAYARPRYGAHAWELPAAALGAAEAGLGAEARARWLARLLLEGKVVPELAPLANQGMLNDPPAHITLCKPQKKVVQIVNILLERNINNFQDIQAIWKKGNKSFLHAAIALWIQPDHMQDWKKLSKSIQAVYLSRGS